MTKIHAVFCVLSSDDKKRNLIISVNDEEIELPIVPIEQPKLLHNELRYHVQSMLLKDTYDPQILEQISFSYLDIQNHFVLQLIQEKYPDKYDLDTDVFILCSIIMSEPTPLKIFSWKEFEFIKSYTNTDLLTSIVDFVVQKSVL